MKKAFLCLGLVFLVGGIFAGCGNTKTTEVTEQENDLSDNVTENATHKHYFFSYDGSNFSLCYPSTVSEGISTQIINELFLFCPEHKLISFDNYLLSDTSYSAHIRLIPLEEFLLQCDWVA